MSRSPLGTAAVVAREAIVKLCAGDLPPLELLEQVARRVRAVVPYSAAGWMPIDPATMLWTGVVGENVSGRGQLALIDNELLEDDFGKFHEVARLRRPVLRLSTATDGQLGRSARYRKLYIGAQIRDELRMIFRARGVSWGLGCMTRTRGEADFSAAEVDFLASIGEHVAHGLRTAQLLRECEEPSGVPEPPGMLVLRDDGAVEFSTGQAERWLAEIPADGLEIPSVVLGVARRARASEHSGNSGAPAWVRIRLPSDRWLVVHGAVLKTGGDGARRTAVIFETAHRVHLAPLIVAMYELTPREREVTELLVRGLPTAEIARELWVSNHTVRDHVKSIFTKLGVRSRPELTALLFHEHFLPTLDVVSAGARVRS